jgi:Flp pilus assembly pilin Flp
MNREHALMLAMVVALVVGLSQLIGTDLSSIFSAVESAMR